jgi:hypothetical protein
MKNEDNEIQVSDDRYSVYMWANAPAAVPHAIARIATVDVDVPLPPPLSRAHNLQFPVKASRYMTRSQPIYPEKKKKKRGLTITTLSNNPPARRSHRLPHKHDKTFCDVLQLRDVAAVEGDTEVACKVPQPRMHTRENQQCQK